jgi:DNA polymerase III subunit epsilon
MTLFFDCETTGRANFSLPPDHSSQPRLVQLAAILTADDGCEIMSINLIVKPECFDIPQQASEIHGITTRFAEQVGIPIVQTLNIFHRLLSVSKSLVAHNIEFDEFILRGEFLRAKFNLNPFYRDLNCFCTMKGMTDFCALPGPHGFKWPKLAEAYHRAFGREVKDAHNAMADVRACMELHFWIKKQT